MVGPSGAGKSTICAKKFKPYEILSIDAIREQFVGDFTRRDITELAWDHLYEMAKTKLGLGERVVIDGTHLRKADRTKSAQLGQTLGVPVFYVIVNRSLEEKTATAGWRERFPTLVKSQDQLFLDNERDIIWGDGLAEVIDTRIGDFTVVPKLPREQLFEELKARGFSGISVIGDVHGQFESFSQTIDWAIRRNHFLWFLGDLIDYGPKNLETVDLAYYHITRGTAGNIIGNHEVKIAKWFNNPTNIHLSDGNRTTVAQLERLSVEDRLKYQTKFAGLMNLGAYHWVIQNVILAHGAVSENLFEIQDTQLRGKLGKFVMFGELDPVQPYDTVNNMPNRIYNWTDAIPKGKTAIVGHDIRSTTIPMRVKSKFGGETIFLDTGSGKGGYLTCADIPLNSMKITNFYRY